VIGWGFVEVKSSKDRRRAARALLSPAERALQESCVQWSRDQAYMNYEVWRIHRIPSGRRGVPPTFEVVSRGT
jgi:hypothetical protein